jgi:predicted transcriptional regulator
MVDVSKYGGNPNFRFSSAVAIVEEKEVGLNGLLVLSKRPFQQSLASYVPDTL